ncbi:MAG: hypothetical protein ACKVQR_09530 [Aquabacterium sp.]
MATCLAVTPLPVAAEDAAPRQVLRETGDLVFHLRGSGAATQLVRRRGRDGAAEVLWPLADGAAPLRDYAPAPGGRWVAVVTQPAGASALLQVLDTRSRQTSTARFDGTDVGALAWTPDARQLAFNRLRQAPPGTPAGGEVWLWTPGSPESTARAVFGDGVAGVSMPAGHVPALVFTHDGLWALGFGLHPTRRDLALWLAPAAGVRTGQPRWRLLVDPAEQVERVTYKQDRLYLLSRREAPRGRILVRALSQPDQPAQVWWPEGHATLTGLAAATDALYISLQDAAGAGLQRRAWNVTAFVPVALPPGAAFRLDDVDTLASAADPRLPGLLLPLHAGGRVRHVLVSPDAAVRETTP